MTVSTGLAVFLAGATVLFLSLTAFSASQLRGQFKDKQLRSSARKSRQMVVRRIRVCSLTLSLSSACISALYLSTLHREHAHTATGPEPWIFWTQLPLQVMQSMSITVGIATLFFESVRSLCIGSMRFIWTTAKQRFVSGYLALTIIGDAICLTTALILNFEQKSGTFMLTYSWMTLTGSVVFLAGVSASLVGIRRSLRSSTLYSMSGSLCSTPSSSVRSLSDSAAGGVSNKSTPSWQSRSISQAGTDKDASSSVIQIPCKLSPAPALRSMNSVGSRKTSRGIHRLRRIVILVNLVALTTIVFCVLDILNNGYAHRQWFQPAHFDRVAVERIAVPTVVSLLSWTLFTYHSTSSSTRRAWFCCGRCSAQVASTPQRQNKTSRSVSIRSARQSPSLRPSQSPLPDAVAGLMLPVSKADRVLGLNNIHDNFPLPAGF